MDNEMSNSMHIAISIIVVSVIIGMILPFVALGKSLSRESQDNVADSQVYTSRSDIDWTAQHGAITAASLYVLLQRNETVIESLSGYAYNQYIFKPEDLIPIFHTKVKLKVDKNQGAYAIQVYEEFAEIGE